MRRIREATHVPTHFGEEDFQDASTHASDRFQPLHRLLKRARALSDFLLNMGDGEVERVNKMKQFSQ
jgi:hypothetical protein